MTDGTAAGIIAALKQACDEDGIPYNCFFSGAMDGCSTMMGPENGVGVQLQELFNIFMLIAHCIAHKEVCSHCHVMNI